ncbi:hypothetical protein NPIL_635471 [Nephila pilipes]|uniref:Secreted protein n=1 Tax=Nephila pilipes TaxID=299642 RepID=A0A8X6U008_NEPPI|nr:hypothetical protein NPIL_635471 [Nephila pilipes]
MIFLLFSLTFKIKVAQGLTVMKIKIPFFSFPPFSWPSCDPLHQVSLKVLHECGSLYKAVRSGVASCPPNGETHISPAATSPQLASSV